MIINPRVEDWMGGLDGIFCFFCFFGGMVLDGWRFEVWIVRLYVRGLGYLDGCEWNGFLDFGIDVKVKLKLGFFAVVARASLDLGFCFLDVQLSY